MMKKDYITPETNLRQIFLEGMIAISTDPNPVNPIEFDARENEESWGGEGNDIWED